MEASKREVSMNGYFKFEKPIRYFSQSENFINYIDPETDILYEIQWIGGNTYYPKRPIILRNPEPEAANNSKDDSKALPEPKVLIG